MGDPRLTKVGFRRMISAFTCPEGSVVANDQRLQDLIRALVEQGRLTHPGIIPVHDLGALADGRCCYVMQRIEGRDLADVLDDLRHGDAAAIRAFPLARLLRIYTQICLVVAYAHDHNVIHRDLKPDNIRLGRYGEVYVADWGLVKQIGVPIDPERPPASCTDFGSVMGTVPYMSPEQGRGLVNQLTPAADVYSLGVILYELLSLRRPFEATTPTDTLVRNLTEEPEDPRLASPERVVPASLAELCLAAIRRAPEERTVSAHAIADRVTSFLDGIEEQERRQAEGAASLAEAHGLHAMYVDARDTLVAEQDGVRQSYKALEPDAPMSLRESLWRQMQAIEERSVSAECLYSRTVVAATRAVERHHSVEGHDLLAELYWHKARDASKRGDIASRPYFHTLVEQHNALGSGRFDDELATMGRLEVVVDAPSARVKVERQVPMGPILVSQEVLDTSECTISHSIAVGSFVVDVSAPGRMPVRVPVVVEGRRTTQVQIRPPGELPDREEFVYVAGGQIQLGGDPRAVWALPERVAEISPFLMGRYPVTLEAYCLFLNDLARVSPERARGHSPRSPDGSMIWLDYDEAHRRFSVPVRDVDGDPWDPHWPALMINWYDAVAYCEWRSEREDAVFRLPTELEWEAAARGADGRLFPWGNGFDSSLCCMEDSVRGKPMPVPVGTYVHDQSPCGVRDMAGLVIEWTSTKAPGQGDRYMMRGAGHNGMPSWSGLRAGDTTTRVGPAYSSGFAWFVRSHRMHAKLTTQRG